MALKRSFHTVTGQRLLTKRVLTTYLRDQADCFSDLCKTCTPKPDGEGLSADAGVYFVIDTNIALHHMPVLEQPWMKNVIICMTVANEVKNQDAAMFARLRDVTHSVRGVVVFSNETLKATAITAKPGESPNDRNDRAVRKVVAWYTEHLGGDAEHPCPPVVLVTQDAACRALAAEEGITALSLSEAIAQYYPDHATDACMRYVGPSASDGAEELFVSKLNAKKKGGVVYPPHWDLPQVVRGLLDGRVIIGTLGVSAGAGRGSVLASSEKESTFMERFGTSSAGAAAVVAPALARVRRVALPDRVSLNRAIHGDVVAVELLSADETSAEKNTGVGRVVHVVSAVKREWCGAVLSHRAAESKHGFLLVESYLPEYPHLRVKVANAADVAGHMVLVAVDGWDASGAYPQGHILRVVGKAGEVSVENEVLSIEYKIPSGEFSDAVLGCLPAAWTADDSEPHRVDLRDLIVCSVDPPGCTDIDDALHCRLLPNGNYEVGVHIADVTHFMQENSPLDVEARNRGNTVYLCDRRISMLPELLTSDLCSIRGGKSRFVFSAIWELTPPKNPTHGTGPPGYVPVTDEHGYKNLGGCEVARVEFCRAIVKSSAALQYKQAQALIDGWDAVQTSEMEREFYLSGIKEIVRCGLGLEESAVQELQLSEGAEITGGEQADRVAAVVTSLRQLMSLSRTIRRGRYDNGAMQSNSSEMSVKMNEARTAAVAVGAYKHVETNGMIEEFMLLANQAVAVRLVQMFPDGTVLRCHPPPIDGSWDEFAEALRRKGYIFDSSTSGTVSASLEAAIDPNDERFNNIVRMVATRCLNRARYFATAGGTADSYSHYGLAVPLYTHFTSPIRRYADDIVHRLLAASLGIAPTPQALADRTGLDFTCANLNERYIAAKRAGQASVGLYTAQLLRSMDSFIAYGYIIGRGAADSADSKPVSAEGETEIRSPFRVFVPMFGFESYLMVPVDTDMAQFYLFDRIPVEVQPRSREPGARRRATVRLLPLDTVVDESANLPKISSEEIVEDNLIEKDEDEDFGAVE